MDQNLFIELAEKGWFPDFAIRVGIRHLLRSRLEQTGQTSATETAEFAREMRESPFLKAAAQANAQHYEVPAEFFRRVLGKRLKYSSGLWPTGCQSLDAAEEAMLALTCERAEIADGMEILDLGCGWGSLSLWLAENYPCSRIVALSNSATQRQFIEDRCGEAGITNLQVLTRNVADFETSWRFDRVVSVEMFEHVRNHAELLKRIADWLKPEGKLFVHIFCHRDRPYAFEDHGPGDWMARHFFTGGIMPSENLLREYGEQLTVSDQWSVNGQHYSRTCEAWLARLDAQHDELLSLFAVDTDRRTAEVRLQRWRMFFLSCAELFAYRGGEEWYVAHYLLEHALEFAHTR
ncbi:MAG: cyclopropane-fatty-acyl-phospholipid synthase family protein [Bythopirellula sp.]|nr:cyclopropane-fatty-acyl-phospholipid synthase family protein [Bythopirellula sp.]